MLGQGRQSESDECTQNNLRVASKTAFATVKSTIDTSNSSNTVQLFLNSRYTV